ncbi:Z1 domain-containing protein [Brevibacterium yomogidense]|uniref:Z1 domain-containing protein n=1 Tax=Brevibacterium yomogidense TaxID=946573 RepID=UPI0018DFC0B0|nr:Z1 domain-containing protein [Brevibacterium yomogidense]
MIDNARRANRLSFDEAVLQIREQLVALQPAAIDDLDLLVSEHQAEVAHATKLSEKSTSFVKDDIARGWYTPHTRPGGIWQKLRDRMSRGSLADAVESIDESSNAIVAHLAEPNVSDDKRKGLVIGNVQSGKTANYAAVIAKAFDEGYKLVIVMSGVHSNLRRQTQRRLEKDLRTVEDSAEWFRLTSTDGDIGRADIKNAANIVDTNSRTLAVVKKNSRRLSNLRDFLRAVDPGTMRDTPTLIIDDESDQATPDSSADGADTPTAINRRMREIWDEVSNATYVGYTATPFANVFMNPAESTDLYPSNFLSVMPTPDNYFGAERLFGLSDASTEAPDVLRYIDDAELEHLLPKTAKDAADFDPQVTESLESAIRWFIIAAAVRRLRGHAGKHSTMLIHTTHRVEPHFLMRDEVNRFLKPLQDEALDGDTDSFYDVFHAEMNRAAELYTGDGPAPTWPSVKAEILNVLRTLRVAVDNGSADESERLDYETETAQTVIVIGGGTLSRGLTLEGLFVSFFTRTSNTYDTLLQMGRWFGYRTGYEDLQRIWVSPGLDSNYRFLATVESDLRIEVERMAAAGLTPDQIGLRIRQHPGRLQITSKNKMKHVDEVEVDFEGQQFQTTKFDVSDPDALLDAEASVRAFLSGLQPYGFGAPEKTGGLLFDQVQASKVLDFLEGFEVHEDLKGLLAGAIQWTREKLPERPWNVVVAGNRLTDDPYTVGDVTVNAVNRAPLATSTHKADDPTINIRALMSAGDLVSDLSILDRLPDVDRQVLTNEKQKNLRSLKGCGDGVGLLVLYPISRTSRSTTKTRRHMSEMLESIDSRLVAPGAPPIFGIGLMTPFDVDGVIRNKGSYVAVRPPYTDDVEEPMTEAIVDDERDFDGGSA